MSFSPSAPPKVKKKVKMEFEGKYKNAVKVVQKMVHVR